MGEPSDFTNPEYWDARYAQGEPPWSHQDAPTRLREFLKSAVPGSVLIPGCGTGHAVYAFHEAGWRVTALDFSPVAVEQARSNLGRLGDKVLLADFFEHDFRGERFSVCYEQSFLCALPPQRWPGYAHRVAQLVCPGGRLIGVFFHGHEPEPPPFPLDDAKAHEILGTRFLLVRNVPMLDSHPFYAGGEHWMEWELRSNGP